MDQSNSPLTASFGRRGLLRIGGLTAASAAFVAACGQSPAGEVGRVGNGQPNPELESEVVNDGVLLRTSASIEQSIADAYARILESGVLATTSPTHPELGDQTELVGLLQEHHTAAAAAFNELAVQVGAKAWTCGNPRLDSVFIDPLFTRVFDGAEATASAQAIGPSDDALRDMINLVHALESLSAQTTQAMVPQLSLPELRVANLEVGVRSARQAALVALLINPGGYLPAGAAGAAPEATTTTAPPTTQDLAAPDTTAEAEPAVPQTEIPLPVAIPSTFGPLGQITWIGGLGDENGVRMRLIFETPSLNSLIYPFITDCDA